MLKSLDEINPIQLNFVIRNFSEPYANLNKKLLVKILVLWLIKYKVNQKFIKIRHHKLRIL